MGSKSFMTGVVGFIIFFIKIGQFEGKPKVVLHLTLLVRGAQCAHTFFRRLFLHENRGLIHYKLSENHQKNFLSQCGYIVPPTQSTFKGPALLGLIVITKSRLKLNLMVWRGG